MHDDLLSVLGDHLTKVIFIQFFKSGEVNKIRDHLNFFLNIKVGKSILSQTIRNRSDTVTLIYTESNHRHKGGIFTYKCDICSVQGGDKWEMIISILENLLGEIGSRSMRNGIMHMQQELRFTVSVVTGKGTPEDIQLKSICGPGDHCEPVLTIMLPHED